MISIPGHRRGRGPLGGAEAPQPAAAVGSQQRASELCTGKSQGKRRKIRWKTGNLMENPSRKSWEDGKIIRKTLEKMNSRGFLGKSTVNGHGNENITRECQENMGRRWKNSNSEFKAGKISWTLGFFLAIYS